MDDGSTDGTAEAVAFGKPVCPVPYVRNSGKGQALGTNLGVQATKARWIALFDDDRLADEDWLTKMLQMAQTTGASCVGSRRVLRFMDGKERNLGRTRRGLRGEHVCDAPDGRYPPKLFPKGCSALIARHVFDRVGYFEEGLELGGYDADCFRAARSAGFRDSYAHEAVVYHLIPRYRVGLEYFKWTSLRVGANFARTDPRFGTPTQVVLKSIARSGLIVKIATLGARGRAAPAHVSGLLS